MFTMHVIVICIIRGNYVLGPVWAVHIEFKKKVILKLSTSGLCQCNVFVS